MSELKVTAAHLRRAAVVYVRQSTLAQVDRNRESTARQYDLVARAERLGWPRSAVRVIDDDLGVSGASTTGRSGFAELAAQVGLGQVGIVLSLECSRLARNNADWYRLLDLAGMTDTLIADADGVYHPGLFNDRLLLGMKGTMSEAELHILRARLDGGIRNKAARGELRRGLPVGLVWGEADGQIRWHPDEAVTGVIATIFDRFAVCGSVRGVWLWLREQGLRFPLQPAGYLRGEEITWVEPTYHAVHNVLTHPAYAGAYVFGKTRQRRHLGEDGVLRTSRRKLPQGEWEVLIPDHHRGFIDWDTYQANQARIGANTRPRAHQPGTGAVREGCALLQGLATCGTCGRKLAVYYDGPAQVHPRLLLHRHRPARRRPRHPAPARRRRRDRHRRGRRVPGRAAALRAAGLPGRRAATRGRPRHRARTVAPTGRAGPLPRRHRRAPLPGRRPGQPAGRPGSGNRVEHRAATAGRRRERARSPRDRAPENPDPARETGDPRPRRRPRRGVVGGDHHRQGPQTAAAHPARRGRHRRAPRPRPGPRGPLLRWKGGAITELSVPLKRNPPQRLRTDEDTIDLLRRLAAHYPDATIAGILNRQGRRTARGLSFTASRVQSLRHHWNIPCHQPSDRPTPRKNRSPWPTPPTNSDSPRPPCTAGWATGSSPVSRSPPARPGASASPTTSARCSSTTPPTAGWPCSRPPSPTASPARP